MREARSLGMTCTRMKIPTRSAYSASREDAGDVAHSGRLDRGECARVPSPGGIDAMFRSNEAGNLTPAQVHQIVRHPQPAREFGCRLSALASARRCQSRASRDRGQRIPSSDEQVRWLYSALTRNDRSRARETWAGHPAEGWTTPTRFPHRKTRRAFGRRRAVSSFTFIERQNRPCQTVRPIRKKSLSPHWRGRLHPNTRAVMAHRPMPTSGTINRKRSLRGPEASVLTIRWLWRWPSTRA